MLTDDHRQVEELFVRFEKTGDGAHKRRQDLVQRITEALSVHASIEEEIFYPAARRFVADAGDDVLEALEEHHLVKLTLAELETMDPSHERYGAKVTVLIENVRHHVEEEEGELFPTIRKALDPAQLREIGDELVGGQAHRTDPTAPRSARHPARQHRRPSAHRTARRRRQPEQGGGPPGPRHRHLTDPAFRPVIDSVDAPTSRHTSGVRHLTYTAQLNVRVQRLGACSPIATCPYRSRFGAPVAVVRPSNAMQEGTSVAGHRLPKAATAGRKWPSTGRPAPVVRWS